MYKIDTKEFESCMLELFGNKDDSTNYPLLWLTTSGKFLYNKLNEEYFHFTHTYVYQRLFTTAFTDKHLKLDSQKEIIPPTWYNQHTPSSQIDEYRFSHNLQIGWAYALYLERDKTPSVLDSEKMTDKKFINSMNNFYKDVIRLSKTSDYGSKLYDRSIEQINFNIIQINLLLFRLLYPIYFDIWPDSDISKRKDIDLLSYVSIDETGDRAEIEMSIRRFFINILRMCRVTSGTLGGSQSIGAQKKEIGIEAAYPLTSSQRNSILDYIQINNIPPERVYIDDHSKEHCIKRQLGLQFF